MEHIFVGGAYFMMDNSTIESYKEIAKILGEKFNNYRIYTPLDIENFRQNYIKNNPNANKNQVDSAMVDYDLHLVKTSKLFVVDVTNKSLGVGIELGTVKNSQTKVVLVAKFGSQISDMVTGAFPQQKVNFYKYEQQLKNIIKSINL